MKLNQTLYLKIYENRLNLLCIETCKEYHSTDLEPFSNEQFLVCSPSIVIDELAKAKKYVLKGSLKGLLLAPDVVVHPMRTTSNPLCEIELTLYTELAKLMWAKSINVHQGDPLEDEEVLALF